jgi:hypothetical protein
VHRHVTLCCAITAHCGRSTLNAMKATAKGTGLTWDEKKLTDVDHTKCKD